MFYHWTFAVYPSDQLESRANPIHRKGNMFLPPRLCSQCGEVESWSRQQYVAVSDPTLIDLRTPVGISEDEWDLFSQRFRAENGLDPTCELYPGASIGIPEYEISAAKVNDVMWPFHEVVVTRRLFDLMTEAGLTGFRAVVPRLTWGKRLRDRGLELPELVVLEIHGRAWRSLTTTVVACQHCGRLREPSSGGGIDPARWDGTDVFYMDSTYVAIGVTDKVRELLTRHRITNFRLIPVEEMVSYKTMLAQMDAGGFTIHPGIPLGY